MAAAALTIIVVLAGAVYLRSWIHHPAIPAWRCWSFFFGMFAIWVAVVSPVASWDSHMLTAHMIQHLLLMTIAPPLIWLGEPLKTMRSAGWSFPKRLGGAKGAAARPEARKETGCSVRGALDTAAVLPGLLNRLLGHPVFCWLAAAVALVAWHAPALFRLGMQSPIWHFVEQVSFLATGLLFWWPVIQPWPSVEVWPRWTMLLYLFLATLPCDVLSGLLVFSDRVAYPMYLCIAKKGGLSPLEDQQCAAALMWTCVTVVFLVAGTILSMQMLSPKLRLKEVVAA